jgi:hypothetical protein
MSGHHDRERPGSAGEDAAVARAWRQASDERPPARLDADVLAAAHRAVRDGVAGAESVSVHPQARRRWMQWRPLAAAATVAGLAFVLVQTLPREGEVAPPIRIEVPASPEAGRTERARDATGAARSPAAEVAAGVADSAEAPAPAAARAPSAGAPPSAADWTARIEALHASGDLAGAASVLRGFRATDPDADAHLPESLRDWARTVD